MAFNSQNHAKLIKLLQFSRETIDSLNIYENLVIPDNIDYSSLSGLSNEVKAKFKEIKPQTMGQALRIDGITPAAVYILLSYVKRKSLRKSA